MPPAPRNQRTPSHELQSVLVKAADAVLLRDGPTGVTVRAVAAEAGVSPMGVYNRFGNKQGLVDLLLIRGFDLLRDAVSDHGGEVDALTRLANAGHGYRSFALDHPQYYALLFASGPRYLEMSPGVSERAAAAFGELVGHVTYAMATGAIAERDAFELAQQIWCCVHGAVSLEMAGQVKTPDPAATYAGLLELLVRGATTPV
jgi:AcrR family transcriptional regulator